jgi:hypothetical protein
MTRMMRDKSGIPPTTLKMSEGSAWTIIILKIMAKIYLRGTNNLSEVPN